MKTYMPSASKIKRKWHLIDGKDQVLGRLATKISQLLIGKNKNYYTPHLDCGDWVVVVNAGQIRVTGKKEDQKFYYWHTNYPGGFRKLTFKQLFAKNPAKVVYWAVKGMLPKNKLRAKRLSRLKIFIDEKHKYENKFKN